MNRMLLSAVLILASAAVAEAQVTVTWSGGNSKSKWNVSWSSGGWGCGGSGYSPGFYYSHGGTTISAGTNFLGSTGYYAPFHGGYYGGYASAGYRYYRPYYRRHDDWPGEPIVLRGSSPSAPLGAPREVAGIAARAELDRGVAKFRSGDYAGAAADFKEAFLADSSAVRPQLWLALALAGQGDFKHADKALRGAIESGATAEELTVDLSLRDAKERARVESEALKSGGLAAAWILDRLGQAAKARALYDAILKAAPADAAALKLRDRTGK